MDLIQYELLIKSILTYVEVLSVIEQEQQNMNQSLDGFVHSVHAPSVIERTCYITNWLLSEFPAKISTLSVIGQKAVTAPSHQMGVLKWSVSKKAM